MAEQDIAAGRPDLAAPTLADVEYLEGYIVRCQMRAEARVEET